MRAVRRPAVLLSALALAVGGLSGCGDDEPDGSDTMTIEPRDPSSSTGSSGASSASSSSSSGSSSSSTSAKGDAPEIPAEAKKHTDEGAVAFAEYYWTTVGEAWKTSDSRVLTEITDKECGACLELIDDVDANKAKGIKADRNPTSVTGSTLAESAEGKADEAVRVEITDREHEYLEDGKSIGTVKKVSYRSIVYVDWKDGAWTVVDSYVIV